MGCYGYNDIFQDFGSTIRDILLFSDDRPYPLYETREEYDNDNQATFKGMLIWESHKYYKDAEEGGTTYTSDVGFYVVPEFGQVTVVPNYEYRQLIVITFDSNSEPDYDPFQSKIVKFIDWFMNKISDTIEELDQGYVLSSGVHMYCHIQSVSNPVVTKSIYVRRTLTMVVRVCHCL